VVDAAIIVVVIVISIAVSASVAFRNRHKFLESKRRFDWVPPSCVVVCATVVFASLMVYSAYAWFDHFLFFAPIIFLTCLVLLVAAAIRKRPRQCLSISLTLVAFLGASWTLYRNESTLRPALRWLPWSHRYKAELVAAPNAANGVLKHIEWDVSGWGPVGPTIVYLVFDPTDALSGAAKSRQPGQFTGIPCEVPRVQRLESRWYAVTFYTEESWGVRHYLNCSGFDG
jgi:amino acid transporter